jgi:hypothetical protein
LLPKPIEPSILTTHPYLTENVAVTDSTEKLHPSTSQTGIGPQSGLQPLALPISSVGSPGDSSNPSSSLSAFTRPIYLPNPSSQYVGGAYPSGLVACPPSVTVANPGTLTFPSVSASVAPYHKKGSSTSLLRRPYTSPALLVKHGHKVQRVIMPTKGVTANGQLTYLRNDFGAGGDMCTETKHTILTPPPTPDV